MDNVFFYLFRQSGLVAQAIIIILFCLSVYAWSVIPVKFLTLRRFTAASEEFLEFFRSHRDPFSIAVSHSATDSCPVYDLYVEARRFAEIYESRGLTGKEKLLDETYNTLQRKKASINLSLKKNLAALATATSVSPLLGLLGTVWGIMSTFRDIGIYGASNISIIAPGIAESLVTTIAGLMVAIPSLVGFNYLNARISNLNSIMDLFSSEYLSRLEIGLD